MKIARLVTSCGLTITILLLVIWLVTPGCETREEANAEVLSVKPSEVVLSGGGNTVTFVVDAMVRDYNGAPVRSVNLPLRWEVSNTALGIIVAHQGYSAIYARTSGSGVNVITVRDGSGAEGVATVSQ